MKIAIATWENRISPVFDTARNLLIVDVEDKQEIKRKEQVLVPQPMRERVHWMKKLGIDCLICGAITRPLYEALRSNGLLIIPYVCGDVDEILKSYLAGQDIENQFTMPGRKRKRYRFGRLRTDYCLRYNN